MGLGLFFGFGGRIGRGMWWFCQAICFVILVTTSGNLGIEQKPWNVLQLYAEAVNQPEALAFLLLGFWINLAATVKRFHDRDKSGVWFLILAVPFIGLIWTCVECGLLAGTLGTNTYGPSGGAALREAASSGFHSETSVQAGSCV